MPPRLLVAAVLALATFLARAQYADPNLQNLLAGLTSGNAVTLITPLTSGMLQVTRFHSPARMSPADAAAYIDRASLELARLGLTTPSAEEIARMLAGGPLVTPSGPYTLPGLLNTAGAAAATLASQIVAPGAPTASSGGNAAPGGTVNSYPLPGTLQR